MVEAHEESSQVDAENGEVIVDGPDGVSVSSIPDAAAETSERLLAAAARAEGQRIESDELRRQEEHRQSAKTS